MPPATAHSVLLPSRDASRLPDDARPLDFPAICAATDVPLRTVRYWVATWHRRLTKLGRAVRVRISDGRTILDAGTR